MTARDASDRTLQLRHMRVGSVTLFFFATLGTLLELLHAFKLPWYLGVAGETRRFLWTLAHAHGAGLGLVNLALAAIVPSLPRPLPRSASTALVSGTILVPGGFLAGGWFVHGGDPGLGAILIPPGALLVLFALAQTARSAFAPGKSS